MGSPRSPRRLAAQSSADLAEYLLTPFRNTLNGLRLWSAQRALREWRVARERARQRRTLAELSDRELRDIGITRYEIDFVLRRGFRR